MISIWAAWFVSVSRALSGAMVISLVSFGSSAQAQSLRDPTVPPQGLTGSTASGAAAARPSERNAMSVMVVDGHAYVVVGSRLYAPGDKLGNATVERIGETQIWLREGKELKKINLYSGVQRRPNPPVKSSLRAPMSHRELIHAVD